MDEREQNGSALQDSVSPSGLFLFIPGRNSSILPVLIASIMSNEREWIEHTLSHAHHEPRGGAVVFTRWLRYDSRQSSQTTGDPFTLTRSFNPFFFFPPLSLPSPFSHCHSANDDGRRGRGALREEEADITKAISRMAHSMRACRVCGQSAIAICLLQFGERLRVWPLQRGTDSAQTPLRARLDSISWIDAATNLGGVVFAH